MAGSLITLLFLLCQLQSGYADPPITAKPGDNVTLPCEAPDNTVITAVEWTRSDLYRDKYVFFKTDGHLQTADQDPSYVNRVQLKDDEMKNGELSLILKNVNNKDGGTYVCRYVEGRGGRRKRADQSKLSSIVQLNVKDGDSEGGKHSGGGDSDVSVPDLKMRRSPGVILTVTLIALVAVSGLVGFVIVKKLKGRSENKSDLPVDDPEVQRLQQNENSQKNITHNISDTQV